MLNKGETVKRLSDNEIRLKRKIKEMLHCDYHKFSSFYFAHFQKCIANCKMQYVNLNPVVIKMYAMFIIMNHFQYDLQ